MSSHIAILGQAMSATSELRSLRRRRRKLSEEMVNTIRNGGSVEIVRQLHDLGANVNASDSKATIDGRTPVHAPLHKHTLVVLLIHVCLP